MHYYYANSNNFGVKNLPGDMLGIGGVLAGEEMKKQLWLLSLFLSYGLSLSLSPFLC